MTPKIEKITREIEKTRARITDDEARLKELERKKIEFENTEIVILFRSVDAAPAELIAFIDKYKQQSSVGSAPANYTGLPNTGISLATIEEDIDE